MKEVFTFTISGRLSGLNEYTRACRGNKYAGAKLKQENEAKIWLACAMNGAACFKFKNKVHITYHWYEKNKRRDLDNIAFAKKFIQDTLVSMGVLQGDGWQYIAGFTDKFYIDKENPRIEVIIREV